VFSPKKRFTKPYKVPVDAGRFVFKHGSHRQSAPNRLTRDFGGYSHA
jgi:hypothetical protein